MLVEVLQIVEESGLRPAAQSLLEASAGLAASSGEWNQAVAAYTRALTIDDRPEIYYRRGLATVQMGRTDDAMPDLLRAARFDPRFAYELDATLRDRVEAAVSHKP